MNTLKIVFLKAGIPMPRVAIVPEKAPNAFATGRDPEHAVVAATEGLLALVDKDELAPLFSTHPPTQERVARLEAMAHGGMTPT